MFTKSKMSIVDQLNSIQDIESWVNNSAYKFIKENNSILALYEKRDGKTSFDIYVIKNVNMSTPNVKVFIMDSNKKWTEFGMKRLNRYKENNNIIVLEFDDEDAAKKVKTICDSKNPDGEEDSEIVKTISRHLAAEMKIDNPTPEQKVVLDCMVLAQSDIGKPIQATTELVTCLKRLQIARSLNDLDTPEIHSLPCAKSSMRTTYSLDENKHVSTGCLALHELINTLTGEVLGTVYGGTVNDADSSDFKMKITFNWKAIEKGKMGYVERGILSMMIWYHVLAHIKVAGQFPLLGLGDNGMLAGAILQAFNAVTIGHAHVMVNCLNDAMAVIKMRPNLRVLQNITKEMDVDGLVIGIEQQINGLVTTKKVTMYNYKERILSAMLENTDGKMDMLNMISIHKKNAGNTLLIGRSNDGEMLLTYEKEEGEIFNNQSLKDMKIKCTTDKTPKANQSINQPHNH